MKQIAKFIAKAVVVLIAEFYTTFIVLSGLLTFVAATRIQQEWLPVIAMFDRPMSEVIGWFGNGQLAAFAAYSMFYLPGMVTLFSIMLLVVLSSSKAIKYFGLTIPA